MKSAVQTHVGIIIHERDPSHCGEREEDRDEEKLRDELECDCPHYRKSIKLMVSETTDTIEL